MSAWVLIFYLTGFGASGPLTTTDLYHSRAACEAAGQKVKEVREYVCRRI